MSEHKLIDGALMVEADGIYARCVCGWDSGPRFSRLIASAAFQEHRLESESDDE